MALVIVSRRNLTQSKTRTISFKFFTSLASLLLLATLALGVFIGGNVNRQEIYSEDFQQEAQAAQDNQISQESSQALIERIGELSARMVQLELEASGLVDRLGVVKEFEQRMQSDRPVPLGPAAKTPPASGGPLLAPLASEGDEGLADSAAQQFSDMSLTNVERQAEKVSLLLKNLDRRVTEASLAYMSFPGRAPVRNAVKASGFGNRKDPFNKRPAFHSGVDFAAPIGTPIYASAGGRVTFSGVIGSYGKVIEIDHGSGLVTRYAHLSKQLVKKNQVVTPGQQIAKMGNSGRSTGSHLHFEILKDGYFVNPSLYLSRF